jgi:hypothetical protein
MEGLNACKPQEKLKITGASNNADAPPKNQPSIKGSPNQAAHANPTIPPMMKHLKTVRMKINRIRRSVNFSSMGAS